MYSMYRFGYMYLCFSESYILGEPRVRVQILRAIVALELALS